MRLGGLQKLTLIDYPGQVAATVFTSGCNFRCPFCHNPELVVPEKLIGQFKEEAFFDFLEKRRGKLDGVCITGGEPTIHADIKNFIMEIKKRGFLVKLDSNGTNPDCLGELFDNQLIDYLAMDLKSSPDNYRLACGVEVDIELIKKSVQLIMNSGIDYEFRTTVVPGIHELEDFDKIAEWIAGANRYALQKYHDEGKILDQNLRNRITQAQPLDLSLVQRKMEKKIKQVIVRQ